MAKGSSSMITFPVGFDWSGAIKDDEIKKTLERAERIVKGKPIAITADFDKTGLRRMTSAYNESFDKIQTRLRQLNEMWSQLSARQIYRKDKTGLSDKKLDLSYTMMVGDKSVVANETTSAKKLYAEYEQLIAALQNFAKSLSQIHQERTRAQADEEASLRRQIQLLQQIGLSGNVSKAGAYAGSPLAQTATDAQITKYKQLKDLIENLTVTYERFKAIQLQGRGGAGMEALITNTLKQRIAAEKELAQVTKTADQAQAEMLKKQEALTAKITARKQAQIAKQAQEQRQIQERIAALKQERAALVLKENTIDNIQKKLAANQALLRRTDFVGDPAKYKQVQAEIDRLTQKIRQLSGESEKTTKKITSGFDYQKGVLNRLIQRMMVYASFGAFVGFLQKVREVTAQFELQRVALGAIIQDQTRANQLFGEIKAFAIKSPLSIMQLTRYTKQVAAYRIETDKLFDTTKRLADVSVGLGVEMGRLVLAYGQVKAATYLRAAEVRQFTEAGIPMLELLAEKFTKLEGTVVSTGEVMDRIKKRMVTFSMVEDVFKDMTDAGGIFYNMQEKQGNTLFGMWAKLGDAASMMYDEIGNTALVNTAMKGFIQLLMDAMKHWTMFANVIQTGAIGFGVYKLAMAGMIPYYDLHNTKVMNSIKNEKLYQANLMKRASLFMTLTKSQQATIAGSKQLTVAEWSEYITKTKLNQVTGLRLARLAATDKALEKALITSRIYTKSQLTQIQSMSRLNFEWTKLKAGVLGVVPALASVGRAILSFLPTAAIMSAVELLLDYVSAIKAQDEAVKAVTKRYYENEVELYNIIGAYRDIQSATKSAGESEDEFIKASYSQKLEQLQKVIKLLSGLGMKNAIDLSMVNYENIDTIMNDWVVRLQNVNDLTLLWGKEVALTMEAYQANVFGWALAGENLKEDIKDWERAWSDMSVNKDFNIALDQLRAIVEVMQGSNSDMYETLSRVIGIDAKLALQQKRRNESELDYQRRIYKQYQNIEAFLQSKKKEGLYDDWLPSMSAADAGEIMSNYQEALDEVMHEFEKTKEAFRGKDALEVRMAIDSMAAQQQWTSWQRDELIDWLNKDPITLDAKLIPKGDDWATGDALQGLKSIIVSEFPTLFNKEELVSIISVDQMYSAIEQKLKNSNEILQKNVVLQNNMAYGSKSYQQSLKTIEKLQSEIAEVEAKKARLAELQANNNKTADELTEQGNLEAELQNVDETVLKTKRLQIAEIVKQNRLYDEQIAKQKEMAENERAIAEAALERMSNFGISTLGRDVKAQFGELMVDVGKSLTDLNYSTDFLITQEDLSKIRDAADLYDLWAKNTKAITDEKEKLAGIGISEAVIAKERAKLDAKHLELQAELNDLETQIAASKEKELYAEYLNLEAKVAEAKNDTARNAAEQNLTNFLKDNADSQLATLLYKREGLKISLQENLLAQGANEQIENYLTNLDNLEDLWKKLGERYNFKLLEKYKGGGSGEDPWILLMKNRMKFMQDFQKGVEDLSKYMTKNLALADEQSNMLGRGLSLQIDSRQLTGSKEELIKWYEDSIEEIRKRIAKLGGKEWSGLGVQMILAKDTKSRVIKKYQELLADMFKELTDFRTEQVQKAIEDKLKKLSDEVSRSKAARDFFNNILSQSKDYDMAMDLTMAVYGDTGENYQEQIINQIKTAFGAGTDWEINVTPAIDLTTGAVNYNKLEQIMLESLKDENLEKYRAQMQKVIDDGRKFGAERAKQWAKDLAVQQAYAQKRVELARYTAERIREIETDPNLTAEAKATYTQLYVDREAKEAAKLEYEAFKDTPLYVAMFEDLENASTVSLEAMKRKLIELRSEWKNLDPKQLKEMQKRFAEIEDELAERSINPFAQLKKGQADIRKWQQDLKTLTAGMGLGADGQGISTMKELDAARVQKANELSAAQDTLNTQLAEEVQYKRELTDLQMQYDELLKGAVAPEDAEARAIEQAMQAKKEQIQVTSENVAKSTEQVDNLQQQNNQLDEQASYYKQIRERMKKAWNGADKIKDAVLDVADSAYEMAEAFGASEDALALFSEIKNAVMAIYDATKTVSQALITISETAVASVKAVESASIILAGISAALQVGTAIANLISGSKARAKERAIKKEQELIDQLTYSYEKLADATDSLFGSAYISNYNQRIKNLQAQQASYMKQAQLEREKGKKADKDKIKDYEESARDAADEIIKMQNEIAETLAGTDVASAARDFASAWLDAYISFETTSDKIKEKFNEMIKNMIIESAMGQIVQAVLQPFYDKITAAAQSDDRLTAEEVVELAKQIPTYTNQITDGLQIFASQLESLGMDLSELGESSEFTGIAREIASASEESITGLAAMINTQNYYISNVPLILQEVQLIRQYLTGGTAYAPAAEQASTTDLLTLQNEYLAHLPAIHTNTEAIAERCERAAMACENIADNLGRVIKPRGFSSEYVVNIN